MISLNSYDECVQSVLTSALSWHSTYGFEFNNREEAALVWLVLGLTGLTVGALLKPDIRSTLIGALRMAGAPKLVIVWISYALWIMFFVQIADWVQIWRAVLTKDTLVWSATTGIVLLTGFTKATELGYFQRELTKVLSVVVVFEYIVNLASFSFWVEFLILQPLLFVVAIPPSVAWEPEQQKAWHRIRGGLSVILIFVIMGHSVRTLHASWKTLDWSLFLLRAVWPVLLGAWVLVIVFPLAVVASYEKAFLRLRMYRDEHTGLWKTKLGLVLALGIRLRWIREAAKGGTYHVAHAESISAAYKAGKRYKTELSAEKRQEAVN